MQFCKLHGCHMKSLNETETLEFRSFKCAVFPRTVFVDFILLLDIRCGEHLLPDVYLCLASRGEGGQLGLHAFSPLAQASSEAAEFRAS